MKKSLLHFLLYFIFIIQSCNTSKNFTSISINREPDKSNLKFVKHKSLNSSNQEVSCNIEELKPIFAPTEIIIFERSSCVPEISLETNHFKKEAHEYSTVSETAKSSERNISVNLNSTLENQISGKNPYATANDDGARTALLVIGWMLFSIGFLIFLFVNWPIGLFLFLIGLGLAIAGWAAFPKNKSQNKKEEEEEESAWEDVVYLNNGSIIRGIIIEQIPNESLKIQTRDGNVFVFKINEVLKITKEKTNH